MKVEQNHRNHRLKDAVGYCFWLLSLAARLVLTAACYWLEHQRAILVAILAIALLFLWIRFLWTGVLRPQAQEG